MKRIYTICFVSLFYLSSVLPAWAKVFKDVNYKHPAYNEVHCLTEYKFMEPLTYTEFKGDLPFTRFHLAESLHAMLGNRYVPETEIIILRDVSPNSKRYPTILRVLRAKLMKLENDGDFNGRRPVNRYELADSLLNLLKFSGTEPPLPLDEERQFNDVDPAYGQIVKAVTNTWQITAGYPDNKFRGSKEITRFEATFMLARAAGLIYEDFALCLEKGGPQPSVEDLVTSDPTTPNTNTNSNTSSNPVDSLEALKQQLDKMEGKTTPTVPSVTPATPAPPSAKPSAAPTAKPTAKPTPSVKPTPKPSTKPTAKPSAKPTVKPSPKPLPSNSTLSDLENALKALESPKPSAKPSVTPTPKPSAKPTAKPSAKPEDLAALESLFASPKPSVKPSVKPSAKPTPKPSAKPSAKPTPKPSAKPTAAPSAKPQASSPSPKPSNAESLSDLEKRLKELRESNNAKPSAQPSARPTPKPEQPDSLVDIPLPSARPSTPASAQPTAKPTAKPSGNGKVLPPPLRSRVLLFGNYRLLYEEVVPPNVKQELAMPDTLQNVSGDAGLSAHLNSLIWFGEPNTALGNLGVALDAASLGGYAFDGVDMTDLAWIDLGIMYRLFGNSSFDIAAGLDSYFRFTSSSNDPRNNYFQASRTYIGVGARLSTAYRILDWWTVELNLAPHYVMQDLSNIAISSVPLNRLDAQILFLNRFDIWDIGDSKLSLELGYKGLLMFDLGSDASQMMHGVVFGTGYHF